MSLRSHKQSRLGSVLLALALATACGGGGESTNGDGDGDGADGSGAPASTDEVVIENFAFMPDQIEVSAGTTVTWTNQDDNEHTIQDEGEAGFEESGELAQGQSFSFTYDTPGSYPYICGIHPYMKGSVVVS